MQIVKRPGWGARRPNSDLQTTWDRRTGFVIHHSAASATQTVRAIQDYHMDTNGWRDIGYNFLIDQSGLVYEGRGWTGIGAHVAGHNTATLGACIIGNYMSGLPSAAALDAAAWLYREANRRKGSPLSVFTHRQLGATSCPGDRLHPWVLANLAGYKAPATPKRPSVGRPAPGPHVAFPLPARHYFGPRNGPNTSVSGHFGRRFGNRTDTQWLQIWGEQLAKRGWSARRGGRYLNRYGNDGKFGPEYAELARAFQRDQGLVVDEKIGPRTWRAAFENPVS